LEAKTIGLPSTCGGPNFEELPIYIPAIRHGYGRVAPFKAPQNLVVLSLYDVLQHSGLMRGNGGFSSDPALALRQRFKLEAEAEIIVTSTGFDPKLEAFFANLWIGEDWKDACFAPLGRHVAAQLLPVSLHGECTDRSDRCALELEADLARLRGPFG
jgi:hypothetical protein